LRSILIKHIPHPFSPEASDASVSKTTKSKWLVSRCETFLDKRIFDSGDINRLVQQTHQLEVAALGHYNCRAEGCERAFVSVGIIIIIIIIMCCDSSKGGHVTPSRMMLSMTL